MFFSTPVTNVSAANDSHAFIRVIVFAPLAIGVLIFAANLTDVNLVTIFVVNTVDFAADGPAFRASHWAIRTTVTIETAQNLLAANDA
jgi:hypothetical protein